MQKSNNGKYYVLTGSNAVMICSNWEQAEYCFHTYICVCIPTALLCSRSGQHSTTFI